MPRSDPAGRAPDRWDVERAVKDSDMPPIARHLMLTLLTYADQGSVILPYRWTPSLTGMAEDTGWHRRTVIRWLDYLESGGWLARIRPAVEDARKRHARTRYTLLIPEKLVTHQPQAGGPVPLGLVAQQPQAGGREPIELVADSAEAGGRPPHIQTSDQPDQPDQMTDLVIRLLQQETGQTVTEDWAAETARLILARPGIKNPRAYLIRILTVDPRKWLPTSQPPQFTQQEEK